MRLHRRGSPRCGHIHTCLVQTAVHQLHVVLPGLLGSHASLRKARKVANTWSLH